MTDTAIAAQLQTLTDAVLALVQAHGARLKRADLCKRLGIHRNTLADYLATDRHFPRPDKTNQWLLADVIKWEMERPVSAQARRETRCST